MYLHYVSSFFCKLFFVKEEQVLWDPNPSVRKIRLRRYTVPVDQQGEYESERLWQHVSAAILRDDLNAATEEKTTLEEAQRGTLPSHDKFQMHTDECLLL